MNALSVCANQVACQLTLFCAHKQQKVVKRRLNEENVCIFSRLFCFCFCFSKPLALGGQLLKGAHTERVGRAVWSASFKVALESCVRVSFFVKRERKNRRVASSFQRTLFTSSLAHKEKEKKMAAHFAILLSILQFYSRVRSLAKESESSASCCCWPKVVVAL